MPQQFKFWRISPEQRSQCAPRGTAPGCVPNPLEDVDTLDTLGNLNPRAKETHRARAEETVMVPREIDHVFSFLTDRTNEPRWWKEATSILVGDYRITNYRAPTCFDFEVISAPDGPRCSFLLRNVDSNVTEVTFTIDVPVRGLMRWGRPSSASALRLRSTRSTVFLQP